MSPAERDRCTCGHEAHEHTRDHGFGVDLDRAPRCTVCTCRAFDWDDEPRSIGARWRDAMRDDS